MRAMRLWCPWPMMISESSIRWSHSFQNGLPVCCHGILDYSKRRRRNRSVLHSKHLRNRTGTDKSIQTDFEPQSTFLKSSRGPGLVMMSLTLNLVPRSRRPYQGHKQDKGHLPKDKICHIYKHLPPSTPATWQFLYKCRLGHSDTSAYKNMCQNTWCCGHVRLSYLITSSQTNYKLVTWLVGYQRNWATWNWPITIPHSEQEIDWQAVLGCL
jgi:hypothetical protein